MNVALKIGIAIGALYILSRVAKSMKNPDVKTTPSKQNFDGKEKLDYTGGGGHHRHGGGGNWRNPYIYMMPYYGYGSLYNYYQPDVCYTKTKTGKLLAHYCNDIM